MVGTYQLCAETLDLCLLCTDSTAQVLELTSQVSPMAAVLINCGCRGASIT